MEGASNDHRMAFGEEEDASANARDGDAMFAWELVKENVQPVRQGREMKKLALAAKVALDPATVASGGEGGGDKIVKDGLWAKVTNSASEDALAEWIALIKWLEQTYATGSSREKELLPALERCTRTLQDEERYKEDARYVRVWIKYADCVAEPGDIFKFMKAKGIGQRQALYYEAYGAYLEVRQAYGAANEAYESGIAMRAEPLERLRASYASFQHRMVRRTQKRIESGEIDEGQGEEIVRTFGDTLRGRGGRLTTSRPAGTGGGLSVAERQRSPEAAPSTRANIADAGLEIFEDDENGAPILSRETSAQWNALGGYKDVRKENTAQASTWAGQRIAQSKSKSTLPASELDVFEDTECIDREAVAAATARGGAAPAGGLLRQRVDAPGVGGDLSHNPMLYHQRGAPAPPLAPGERPATLYRAFSPAQLRSADGEEVCYEENRAAAWISVNGAPMRPIATRDSIVNAPAETKKMNMDVDMGCDDGNRDAALSSEVPQGAVQATYGHDSSFKMARPREAEDEIVSKRTYVAPEPPVGSRCGSCASEPSEAQSIATGAAHVSKPPAKAAAAAAVVVNNPSIEAPKVRAGARWTADEEGTRAPAHEPTMTICTKEAWGDIMSMFSDSVATGTAGYEADASGDDRAAAKKPERVEQSKNADRDDGGFTIREDTCLLPKDILAARLVEARKPVQLAPVAVDDGGFFIREDTVALPSDLGGMTIREDTECIPKFSLAKTPLSVAPAPAPLRRPFSVLENTPVSCEKTKRSEVPKISSNVKRPALAALPREETPQLELVNPFKFDAMDAHLRSLDPPLCEQPGVTVDTKSSTIATLSEAAKCVSKGGKRAAAGVKVTLGDVEYVFKGRVGEGAHAEVYEAELETKARTSSDGDIGAYAVKVQEARYAKWEFVVARRLRDRLPVEASAAVNWAQPTALHLIGGRSSDGEDAAMGALVMPFGEHGTLQDVLNSYLSEGKQMHETLVMYYAVEMLRLVEWIHGAGIVHADLKPDNLLLRNGGDDWCDWAAHRPGSWMEKGLALIDFGRAIDLTMYPEEAAFIGDAGAEAFRCIEMMQGKPWTYQADCYAIASTIHCLLYGSYMDVELTPGTTHTYRQRQPLRRYWKTELWEVVFDRLLNQPTESTPPPLGSLRSLLEEHMRGEGQNIRKLLMHQTIDMYQQIRDGKLK